MAVLKSLEKLFKKEGYEVTCVSSGKQELEGIERRDLDLVIVDIRMPDLDGIETTKRIKEIRRNQNPAKYIPSSIINKTDRFSQLGIAAAKLAIEDSKLDLDKVNKDRASVSIGSGLGGVLFHEEQISTMYEKGFKKAEPLGVSKVAPNAVSGYISIIFGLTSLPPRPPQWEPVRAFYCQENHRQAQGKAVGGVRGRGKI